MDMTTTDDPAGDPAATTADAETVEMTVAVYAAPDGITAELVRGALEAEGVAAVIGEQVADAFGGPLQMGEGFWGEVRVPAHDADRAREVLQSFEEGQGAASDAELTAQAEAASDPQV